MLSRAPAGSVIYLLGAGGCGVSALGHLLLDMGFRLNGSDVADNETIDQLRARGAQIHPEHQAANLIAAQPFMVVYSSAIRSDNPELLAALRLKIPIVRRAILLAALMRRQYSVCVAGMHGKTTTTALLAFALENLHANPSYSVGALVPQLRRHARLSLGCDESSSPSTGDSSNALSVSSPSPALPSDPAPAGSSHSKTFFVAETDESDGTLCEFTPECSIVLNIDEEHLDFYANLEAVCRSFQRFGEGTRKHLYFCADDSRLGEIFARRPNGISFGLHPLSTYRCVPLQTLEGKARMEVWYKGSSLGVFTLSIFGEKNLSNATAVVAFLHHHGFAPDQIADAMSDFRGAARRQQEVFSDGRFRIVDDYAHHPAEITATLQSFRERWPGRLLVAFQPHRYSRTAHLLPQFAKCFEVADRLWLTDIYAASEEPLPGVTGQWLADAVSAQRKDVHFVPQLTQLPQAIRSAMMPGDAILFLGAGDITRVAHDLAAELRQEPVNSHDKFCAELASVLTKDSVLRRDESLARRTTLRVGGRADFYLEPSTEAELSAALKICKSFALPVTVLGRGSNLLIRDGGIRGLVVCLCHPNFNRLEISGNKIRAGAGVKLKAVSVEARRAGLTGLEFLEGIPGSVGGALRMNAGAMGSWMFEWVESIRFMDFDGHVKERQASEVYVEYRGCPLLKTHIALGAVLKGEPASSKAVQERMNSFSKKRWESQPAAPSAGCIFKNPHTIPAGKLIDELGLKGSRIGGAMVSDIHGNFIVNDGNATANDVLKLIAFIKQEAKQKRGIDLETEVEILGDDPAN